MPIQAVLPGYPIYQGSKKISVVDLKGPVSYAGGGETIQAAQFGQGGIDAVEPLNKGIVTMPTAAADSVPEMVALSMSGTYFVTITFGTGTNGDAVTSVTIKWYVTATGVEAGAIDLSAEIVRALFIFV